MGKILSGGSLNVLRSIERIVDSHRHSLCPPLQSLRGHALAAQGRIMPASASFRAALQESAPRCGHQLTRSQVDVIRLWLSRYEGIDLRSSGRASETDLLARCARICNEMAAGPADIWQAAWTYLQLNRLNEVEECAARLSTYRGDIVAEIMAAALSAYVAVIHGDLIRARSLAQRSIDLSQPHVKSSSMPAAKLGRFVLRACETMTGLADARTPGHGSPSPQEPVLAAAEAGLLSIERSLHGDRRGASDLGHDILMPYTIDGRGLISWYTTMTLADLAWCAGDVATAKHAMHRLRDLGAPTEALIVEARLHLDLPDARAKVLRALSHGDGAKLAGTRYRLMALHALWKRRSGERTAAHRSLQLLKKAATENGTGLYVHQLLTVQPEWAEELGLDAGRGAPSDDSSREHGRKVSAVPATPASSTILSLTSAERRVLGALDSPFTAREIAQRFDLSIHTVRTQIRSVYAKLGVHRRSEAVGFARSGS